VNPDDLGQFIMQVFAPFIPLVAGGVMAVILTLLLILLVRKFLPEQLEI
jgi:membrane protein implicated in regulation of membrane protease activity